MFGFQLPAPCLRRDKLCRDRLCWNEVLTRFVGHKLGDPVPGVKPHFEGGRPVGTAIWGRSCRQRGPKKPKRANCQGHPDR